MSTPTDKRSYNAEVGSWPIATIEGSKSFSHFFEKKYEKGSQRIRNTTMLDEVEEVKQTWNNAKTWFKSVATKAEGYIHHGNNASSAASNQTESSSSTSSTSSPASTTNDSRSVLSVSPPLLTPLTFKTISASSSPSSSTSSSSTSSTTASPISSSPTNVQPNVSNTTPAEKMTTEQSAQLKRVEFYYSYHRSVRY